MANVAQTVALHSSPAPREDKASLTAWVAVLAGMIGAFMAILNIQITNALAARHRG